MFLGRGFGLVGSKGDSFPFFFCSDVVLRLTVGVLMMSWMRELGKRKGIKIDILACGVDQILAVVES